MMATLSFFEWMMAGIFATSASLIVYHHVGYPVLLKWMAGRKKTGVEPEFKHSPTPLSRAAKRQDVTQHYDCYSCL